MCYSTIVLESCYDNLPGVTYHRVETDIGTFSFAQGVQSVLPALLEELTAFRKAAKKKMAEAHARGDEFGAALHNSEQLAFKVTMNSAYGFTGTQENGYLSCTPIAASVTAMGRQMLEKTKALVESMGPGTVPYGDTDSVFCLLDLGEEHQFDRAAHFARASWLAEEITKQFPNPVFLEMEKLYQPFLLKTRKMYAGLMYADPDNPDKPTKLDTKGLSVVRRDSCKAARKLGMEMLHEIMYNRSVPKAIDLAHQYMLNLLGGKIAVSDLVLSKKLRPKEEYKNSAAVPHLLVADKIFKRTGEAVPQGKRVEFIPVRDRDNPDASFAECAEDPTYIVDNGLQYDVMYYLNKQLGVPVKVLLALTENVPESRVIDLIVSQHPQLRREVMLLEKEYQSDLESRRKRDAVARAADKREQERERLKQPRLTDFIKKRSLAAMQ
jgi:DNA polymerase delta subunit 1